MDKNDLIVCLRIYINELNTIFLTVPNSIILLYDITSEDSFDTISFIYEKLIKEKKYENIKFIFVGNKKDLIKEEEEKTEDDENKNEQFKEDDEKENLINNKDESEKKIIKNYEKGENKNIDKEEENKIIDKQAELDKKIEERKVDDDNIEEKENEKENAENEENKKKIINFEKKIENYCKEKKIMNKEISGISGEGVKELFKDLIIILYNDIQNLENENKEMDLSFSFYKNIENELNLSSSGRSSYHSEDYKKEIDKINKKRNGYCCIRCTIF